jgi:hypothetical protein
VVDFAFRADTEKHGRGSGQGQDARDEGEEEEEEAVWAHKGEQGLYISWSMGKLVR